MESSAFVINNRFVINSDKNELFDKQTKVTSKLEPRLMKLLCLLAGQNNQVVKREYIINYVWNDYPGAGEGLNQAVSFLRKVLNDEQKTIIKTLPKSGYSFHGTVSYENERKSSFLERHSKLFVAVCLLLLLVFVAIDVYLRKTSPQASSMINEKRDAEISRLDSIHQAEHMRQFSKDTIVKK